MDGTQTQTDTNNIPNLSLLKMLKLYAIFIHSLIDRPLRRDS